MNGRQEHDSASIALGQSCTTRRSAFCYGVGTLPIIRELKTEFPAAKQQWCAYDESTAGYCADIRAQFERLQQLGSKYGYFPESSKSVLIVTPHNVEQDKVELAGLKFRLQAT